MTQQRFHARAISHKSCHGYANLWNFKAIVFISIWTYKAVTGKNVSNNLIKLIRIISNFWATLWLQLTTNDSSICRKLIIKKIKNIKLTKIRLNLQTSQFPSIYQLQISIPKLNSCLISINTNISKQNSTQI